MKSSPNRSTVEKVTGRRIEWHQVCRGLWIVSASHPTITGYYARNERDARAVVKQMKAELVAEHRRAQKVWPHVKAQLERILGVG